MTSNADLKDIDILFVATSAISREDLDHHFMVMEYMILNKS